MKFGEHIKERRLGMGLSLRAFCLKHDEDPSNWSKLERGVLPPPKSYERLLQIAQYLGYEEDTPKMQEFFDLAHISQGSIPPDIAVSPDDNPKKDFSAGTKISKPKKPMTTDGMPASISINGFSVSRSLGLANSAI